MLITHPAHTVLIVENILADREQAKQYLLTDLTSTYQILIAASAAEGLELCRSNAIDVILLNYSLPDANGLEFLKTLCAQSNGNHPAVVMVAANCDVSIAVSAIKLGAADYLLQRDLTPELLQQTVHSAIANARLPQCNDRLSITNEQIMTIWESMTDAYVTLDREWRIIYTNSTATAVVRQLVGLTPPEFLGKTHWEIFPWAVGNIIEQEYRRAVTEQVAVNFEALYEPTQSWFEIHAYPSPAGLGVYFRDITERKSIEAQRNQAILDLDQFFDLSPDLLVIADFEGYFLRLNPSWEQTLGFTTAELRARPYLDWVHPDDHAATLAISQSLQADEVVIRFENRYRCKDGSYRGLSWSARLYNKQNLIYAVAHDITERKQSEAALAASERKFKAIFDQTFELMGLVSLDGVLLEINQSALASISAQASDIIGKKFWETPWWDHSQALQSQLQRAIAQAGRGEFIGYEVSFPNAHGEMRISDFSLKPVMDETDRVTMLVAEGHEITDRKRAEQRLLESEERLKAGVQVAGVGLAQFDYATNLVELSPEAAALYGFSQDELVVSREQVHATFHPDERPQLEAIIAQVLSPQSDGWFAHDHRVVWPNGEVRYLSVRKKVFFEHSEQGSRPRSAILAAIDVTERRQLQTALEERNRDLDSFVYMVSHDLKAPLRAISSLSQWIEDDLEGSLSAEIQKQMTLLRSRVRRLQEMINTLLDYARIGRTNFPIEPVAVAELLAETIDELTPPPTFTVTVAPNLPTLLTKRLPLFQVFCNLISNGIKHHDRIDGSVHISGHDGGDFYEFVVIDDGPGIEPKYHDRIFTIFQAINPQNRPDSTGIGLSIVKKIIETEGGTIRLESAPRQGSRFYFTWPKQS